MPELIDRSTSVKKLILEPPDRAKYRLNIDLGITDKEWAEVINATAALRQGSIWILNISRVASAMILEADRRDELDLDDDLFEELISSFPGSFGSDDDPEFVRILFPTKDPKFFQDHLPFSFVSIKRSLAQTLWTGNFPNPAKPNEIFRAFILYPERFQEATEIPGLRHSLETLARNQIRADNFLNLADTAAAYRLLYPQDRYAIVDNDTILAIEELAKTGGLSIFIRAKLKIFMAEDVQMTSDGLQIVMPERETNQTIKIPPPIPKVLKY